MPLFFDKIGVAKDLFDKKKYDLNKTVQISTKTKYGKVKSKTVLDSKKLKNKFTFNKTVDKVGDIELTTSGSDLNVEVTNADVLKNSTVTAACNLNSEYSLEVEYANGSKCGRVELSKGKGDLEASVTGTCEFDSVSVAVEAKFAPDEQFNVANLVKDYNAAVNWAVDDATTYSLKTSDRCDNVQATFTSGCCTNGMIAGRLNYDLLLGRRSVEVASAMKYGSANIQTMLDSDGQARFLYKRSMSDQVKASLGASYNMVSGGEWNTSWKFEFSV